jgi:hypothetical protein
LPSLLPSVHVTLRIFWLSVFHCRFPANEDMLRPRLSCRERSGSALANWGR